jgi:hypothetical protein
MKTHNFKKDIDYRFFYGLIICMALLLNVIANDACGYGPICSSPCDSFDFDYINWTWRCMGCIADCSLCYSCASGTNGPECVPKYDMQTQSCCSNSSTGKCSNICNYNECKNCEGNGSGNCISSCNPNQKCCNGACCDKVWIKKTIPAINQNCPSCVGNAGCAGNNCKIASSYDECSNVGVGSGEHCQCNSQEQTIGYIYHCVNNFDVSKLLWCALKGTWCAAVCIETMSPSMCANCLAGASVDCCDGPCELCDFIESCDPDTAEDMEPVKANVFTGFGC